MRPFSKGEWTGAHAASKVTRGTELRCLLELQIEPAGKSAAGSVRVGPHPLRGTDRSGVRALIQKSSGRRISSKSSVLRLFAGIVPGASLAGRLAVLAVLAVLVVLTNVDLTGTESAAF